MSSYTTVRQAVSVALGTASAAAASLAIVPQVMAADTAAKDSGGLEEVVVTGSRIRRVDVETASPVLVIDSQAIQQSGITTVGDLVSRIPTVAGAATNPQVNNGGGYAEANIELRGLDPQRTLILVDGRRIGLVGQTKDATDVNQIPINLIERVEVLKEGAGAIYGSDAIGGVVNFITRKDVDGFEFGADYGRTSHKDGAHHSFTGLFGTNTDKFNLLVGGNYQKQDAVSAGDRDFSRFAQYLYGGTSGVIKGGSSRTPTGRIFLPPGNSFGCGSVTRIAGAAGTTPADYRCFAGAADRFNYQPLNLVLTPSERAAVFSKVNYNINDNVTAYAAITVNRTHSGYQIAPLPFDAQVDDVVLSKNSVYNPFGIDFGGLSGANPNFLLRMSSLGNRRSDTVSNSSIVNGGLKGKVGATSWDWDLNLTYSRLDQLGTIDGYLLKPLLGPALGPSFIDATGAHCGTPTAVISGCVPVNFFNPTTPDQITALKTIAAFYNTNNTYRYKAAGIDFTGKVVDLPAGALQASVGAEYSQNQGAFLADSVVQAIPPLFLQCQLANEACTGNSSGKYDSRQLFLEVFAPLLKDLPGVKALNVDIGVRHSNYSLFGKTTKADFKLEYRPISDVLLRGTFSQVFRVPTVLDIASAPQNTSVTFNDPCTGLTASKLAGNPNLALACQGVPTDGTFAEPNGQITGLNKSNPNLKPETGHVSTVGIVYSPQQVENLSFDVDYWKYQIDGLITLLDSNYSIGQCVATGSPTFCSLVHRFAAGTAAAGQILVFENPRFNLGQLKTDGVDFGTKYALKHSPIGSFQFGLDVTRLIKYTNIPAPGAAPQEISGTYSRQFGNYARYRALGSVGWSLGGFDGLLTIRYIDKIVLHKPSVNGFKADLVTPYPDLKIPSFTYLDAVVGYTFPTKTRVQIGVRNIGDKQPPLLYQNNVTNGNTDVQTYDSVGRLWFLGFNHKLYNPFGFG